MHFPMEKKETDMSELIIRMARPKDAKAILAIYEPYILETAITFEVDIIPLEIFEDRMSKVQKQFPWLVGEKEGKIVGYAYCSSHYERAAFAWDCECSVYIAKESHHQGIATALYTKLFQLIAKQGYYNIYSLIAVPHESSVALHKKFGFTEVGTYLKTGYKLGTWWDLLILEKRLCSFDQKPTKPWSIHEINIKDYI